MRIYGNRQLKTIPGQTTRPTSAKVREAIFNIWQGEIAGCCWLDLCAGTGSMGAEALCRDAKKVVGIEKYGKACQIIRENWQAIAKPEQTFQIIKGDVLTKIKHLAEQQFDRIYFDPPYDSYLYLPVLKAISSLNLLAPTGEIAVEHDLQQWEAKEIPGLTLYRTKTYGKTAITFYSMAHERTTL